MGTLLYQVGLIFIFIFKFKFTINLGSGEIEQISRISKILGSPTPENWENCKETPDYGKIIFNDSKPSEL